VCTCACFVLSLIQRPVNILCVLWNWRVETSWPTHITHMKYISDCNLVLMRAICKYMCIIKNNLDDGAGFVVSGY